MAIGIVRISLIAIASIKERLRDSDPCANHSNRAPIHIILEKLMSIHILHPVTGSTAPSLVDVLILRFLIMRDTEDYFEPDELSIALLVWG